MVLSVSFLVMLFDSLLKMEIASFFPCGGAFFLSLLRVLWEWCFELHEHSPLTQDHKQVL